VDNTEPNYLSIWITAIERMMNDSDEILFIERMEAV